MRNREQDSTRTSSNTILDTGRTDSLHRNMRTNEEKKSQCPSLSPLYSSQAAQRTKPHHSLASVERTLLQVHKYEIPLDDRFVRFEYTFTATHVRCNGATNENGAFMHLLHQFERVGAVHCSVVKFLSESSRIENGQ